MAGHGLRRPHRCQRSALTPGRDACEVRKGVSSAGSQGADGCGRMQTCADRCGRVPDTLASRHLCRQLSPMVANDRQWSTMVATGRRWSPMVRRSLYKPGAIPAHSSPTARYRPTPHPAATPHPSDRQLCRSTRQKKKFSYGQFQFHAGHPHATPAPPAFKVERKANVECECSASSTRSMSAPYNIVGGGFGGGSMDWEGEDSCRPEGVGMGDLGWS